MYFWRIDSLTKELGDGTLPQKERMEYLLGTVIVYTLALEMTFFLQAPVTAVSYVESVSSLAFAIAGTVYCYFINRSGDNREFIDRFVCLGWVAGIRTTVLFVLTYVMYLIIGQAVGGEEFTSWSGASIVDLAFMIIVSGLFYWLLGNYIKLVTWSRD